MKLLENKVALITGAAQGIGRATAELYAEHGAHVVVSDVKIPEAQTVADGINAAGRPKAVAIPLDVADPEMVHRQVQAVVGEFGRIDILVNNAAILIPHPFIEFPLEDFDLIFGINVRGVFVCSQVVARQIIEQGDGGCIVNISSISGKRADPELSAYGASKAAVIGLTRVMARELGPYGIRVNVINPGATETAQFQGLNARVPGIREELLAQTPLGRLAEPIDQAKVALFLASDLAGHITGEQVTVSGGEFMET